MLGLTTKQLAGVAVISLAVHMILGRMGARKG